MYDLLKIFKIKIKLKPDCYTLVAPRRIMLSDSGALSSDDRESIITQTSFTDNSSFSSVREYKEGDNLKHVHWKLSAKHDELMVKQPEQELGSNAVIIADTRAVFDSGAENMRAVDAVIEAALAVAAKTVSDGRTAVNIFRSADGTPCAEVTEDPESYEKLFYIYSALPSDVNGIGAVKLAKDMKGVFAENETLFIFTPAMEGDELSEILRSGAELCTGVRVFLTASKPSAQLLAAAGEAKNVLVRTVDPDNVSLSLIKAL